MLVSAQSANPAAGTWQLNVAKSKYSPGPAPKSSTIKIVANADGSFTQTVDSVPTTGARQSIDAIDQSRHRSHSRLPPRPV